jgi:hypothetical protein
MSSTSWDRSRFHRFARQSLLMQRAWKLKTAPRPWERSAPLCVQAAVPLWVTEISLPPWAAFWLSQYVFPGLSKNKLVLARGSNRRIEPLRSPPRKNQHLPYSHDRLPIKFKLVHLISTWCLFLTAHPPLSTTLPFPQPSVRFPLHKYASTLPKRLPGG